MVYYNEQLFIYKYKLYYIDNYKKKTKYHCGIIKWKIENFKI